MITVEKIIPPADLIEKVRGTSLLGDPDTKPYEYADIAIEEMRISDLAPTTLYVIKRGLKFQHDLRQSLLAYGHDPLRLERGLQLREGDSSIGLVPPIVEEDAENGPYLIDGAHRTYVARKLGVEVISVLRIRDVLQSAPFYAFPNEWDEIIEYDETPADPVLKKHYRGDSPRSLYRDFSKLNGSTMREPGTQK
jgi:hypothetical protein